MTLFDAPFPIATHRNDPSTSRAAERRFAATGTRATHCQRVLSVVKRYPCMTAIELLPWLGLTEYQVRRRLTDLKNMHRIRIAGTRRCGVKGTTMSTWEVTA